MEKSSLIVDNDISVRIEALHQEATYAGLLEGLPTTGMNDNIIQRAVDKAKKLCFNTVHLIEPEQTPIEYDGLYLSGSWGSPSALPIIICIASISCFGTFRDKELSGSALTIVWFQGDYAFPIDAEILEKIKQVPYRQICDEFDY